MVIIINIKILSFFILGDIFLRLQSEIVTELSQKHQETFRKFPVKSFILPVVVYSIFVVLKDKFILNVSSSQFLES